MGVGGYEHTNVREIFLVMQYNRICLIMYAMYFFNRWSLWIHYIA